MEYTQLIHRVLNAEQDAQLIAQQVEVRRKEIAQELTQEIDQMRTTQQTQAQSCLAQAQKQSMESRDASMQAQDVRRDNAMAQMERAYELYKDNWVDTLFHLIVGQQR